MISQQMISETSKWFRSVYLSLSFSLKYTSLVLFLSLSHFRSPLLPHDTKLSTFISLTPTMSQCLSLLFTLRHCIYDMLRSVFMSRNDCNNSKITYTQLHTNTHSTPLTISSFPFNHSTYSQLVNYHDKTRLIQPQHTHHRQVTQNNSNLTVSLFLSASPLLQLSVAQSISCSLTEWINRLSKV